MNETINAFKSAGAQSVAGSIILNREVVAILRHGQTILTPEGETALAKIKAKDAVEDVEVKEVRAPEAKEPTVAKAKKPKAAVAAPAPVEPDPLLGDLDTMLAAQ